MSAIVGSLLKQRDEGKKNDDRARVGDLALNVATFRNVGAHARGRVLLGLV